MERMIAERPFFYAGVRLESGEQFFARDGHVPFLTKTRRATKYATRMMTAAPVAAAPIASPEPVRAGTNRTELAELRAEYERVLGVAPNSRLGANRLRRAIDAHTGNLYGRRDMQAEH